MKSLVLACAACLALTSCTTTNMTTGNWSLRRTSFLQRLEIPEVTIETNGVAVLRGYKTDGGNDALAAVISAAVSAAINAMKP